MAKSRGSSKRHSPASAREREIVYESRNQVAWVRDDKRHYVVFINGLTHATSDSAYAHDADGLSIAKARADYIDKSRSKA